MKKKSILIVVLLLVALSVVGAVVYLNRPKVVARNALAGVAEDLLDRAELKPLVKMSQKGSVSLSAEIDTGTMYGSVYGDDYIGRDIDASFGGKLYFGKSSLFLKNAYLDLSVPAEKIDFDAQADLYVGKRYAYIESDLVGGAVGIIRGEMTEALKNSELAPEMPEELYRELLPAMKRYDGISRDGNGSGEKALLKHLAGLLACFEENATYEVERRELLLQGESVKCRVITVTLDRGDLLALLHELSEMLNDESLCVQIDQNQWLLQPLLTRMGLISEYAQVEKLSAYLNERLDAEVKRQESLDADSQWILELATPRRSSKLLSLRLFTREETLFSLDFGKKGLQKTDDITVCVRGCAYTYSISRKGETGEKGYGADLYRAQDDGEKISLFFFSVDKETDSFAVFWREGDLERYLTGSWVETQKSTTVTLERFTDVRGNFIDEGFCVEMTFTVKDSMPKALNKKEVRNLFDLTLDDVWEIITKSKGLLEFFM